MPKRGANGVIDTRNGQAVLHGANGDYKVYRRADMVIVGRVYRMARHTVRTNYRGRRYGFDRTHSCWWGHPSDPMVMLDVRCRTSMTEVVSLLLRDHDRAS